MTITGERITARMTALELNKAETARRLTKEHGEEVSAKRFGNYANGTRDLPSELVGPLCRVLKTHSDYLYGLSDDPSPPQKSPASTGGGNKPLTSPGHPEGVSGTLREEQMQYEAIDILDAIRRLPAELAERVIESANDELKRRSRESGVPPQVRARR